MGNFLKVLLFGIFSIIFFSCNKSSYDNSASHAFDGSWKITVLESGCGYSQPLNITITAGAFSVSTFPIICTPLVNYTFGISGTINSNGTVSGVLTSPNYGPPVSFTGDCSSPDSCSATGSGIGLTINK
jgi:hypothetical protein